MRKLLLATTAALGAAMLATPPPAQANSAFIEQTLGTRLQATQTQEAARLTEARILQANGERNTATQTQTRTRGTSFVVGGTGDPGGGQGGPGTGPISANPMRAEIEQRGGRNNSARQTQTDVTDSAATTLQAFGRDNIAIVEQSTGRLLSVEQLQGVTRDFTETRNSRMEARQPAGSDLRISQRQTGALGAVATAEQRGTASRIDQLQTGTGHEASATQNAVGSTIRQDQSGGFHLAESVMTGQSGSRQDIVQAGNSNTAIQLMEATGTINRQTISQTAGFDNSARQTIGAGLSLQTQTIIQTGFLSTATQVAR